MDTLAADEFVACGLVGRPHRRRAARFVTGSGWEADGAHRELAGDAGDTVKQVRLHTMPDVSE